MSRQDLKILMKKEEVSELWIGDTGASSHMCKVWKGFSNVKNVNINAEFTSKDHEGKVSKTGTWTGVVQVLSKQGHIKSKQTIELQDVLYIPELRTKLFCITKEIETKGATISNDDDILILRYPDGSCIYFDIYYQHQRVSYQQQESRH